MTTCCLPVEVERVLLTADELKAAVDRLAARVNMDYGERELVVVGALTGAATVTCDLIRRLTMPVALDFVSVSSYGDGTSGGGELRWQKALSLGIEGADVLLVDDIIDTGHTLRRLQEALLASRPASLATLALLDKPSRREVDVAVDYIGLQIPDEFVVGYGLDWAQRFRNLPFVGVLRREVYS